MEPEGNSWKLCLIAGCSYIDDRCFNCGSKKEIVQHARSEAWDRVCDAAGVILLSNPPQRPKNPYRDEERNV